MSKHPSTASSPASRTDDHGVVSGPPATMSAGATAELRAAIALAEATFSEGFCPFCGGRLSPLAEYDVERTRDWYAPPTAACLTCERAVGRYPEGGVHGSTLHPLDLPAPKGVSIRG